MTAAQKAAIERYFIDLENVKDSFQLYTGEDKIRGALLLLLDTQELTSAEYHEWDRKLLDKVSEIEDTHGY